MMRLDVVVILSLISSRGGGKELGSGMVGITLLRLVLQEVGYTYRSITATIRYAEASPGAIRSRRSDETGKI